MKKILIALTAMIFLNSCKQETKEIDNSLIVAGQIENYTDGKFYLIGDEQLVVDLDEEGKFQFNTEISNPKYFIMGSNDMNQSLFCMPGDSIYVSYNTKNEDKIKATKFSGDRSEENHYLTIKGSEFNRLDALNINMPKLLAMPNTKVDSIFKSREKKFSKLLDENTTKNAHPDFLHYERFWNENNMLIENLINKNVRTRISANPSLLTSYDPTGTLKDVKIDTIFPKGYSDVVSKFNINDSKLLTLNENEYMTWLELIMSNKYPELNVNAWGTEDNKKPHWYKIIDEYKKLIPDTLVYDAFLYRLHKQKMLYSEHKLVKETAHLIQNKERREEVLETINRVLTLNSTPFPEFNATYTDGKPFGKKDLLGKYTYIDFWATWCGPCKMEIPYLQKLEEEYRGKNINFVSISTDRNRDVEIWKNMVKDMKLTGTQVMMDEKSYQEVAKLLVIESIPRFVLLDPNGVVINNNADRPSSETVRSMLNQLENL
ncbi:thiol-disulfide isomerase/thioredoxin [Tenacibaculum adriaticum]|uniref:Thiol-disulfide isomerase/thioredoxin n=1 Tax=Tenacibaculum adriaticum TaxID=413713 RepID=A0A5S5DY58_9FLAO|nr:TlpA disulfide reductase family protein [Tenacibaculum adriaticum]TYQ00199.1 thiol-disulfide isomerase/thioredoxin [Tenacibaculum adriaticum]